MKCHGRGLGPLGFRNCCPELEALTSCALQLRPGPTSQTPAVPARTAGVGFVSPEICRRKHPSQPEGHLDLGRIYSNLHCFLAVITGAVTGTAALSAARMFQLHSAKSTRRELNSTRREFKACRYLQSHSQFSTKSTRREFKACRYLQSHSRPHPRWGGASH